MEKVLITGATGFVGRYIMEELLNKGYKVYVLARNFKKVGRIFGDKVEGAEVDFLKREDIKKAFERIQPNYLVHLIGILFEDRKRGSTFYNVHYLFSKNLYEIAKDFPTIKKVAHMSALGTHKDAPSEYHKTKYMAEEFLKTSGLRYTIFRPSIILGPEQKLFSDMWNITKLISVVALPGSGSYLFQPVDARDVACAFVSSLEREESNWKIYELCGSEKISFKQLLEDIFSKWNRKVMLVPMPKVFMYLAGKVAERLFSTPPFSSDQILMMWKDNVCGLDPEVESDGVRKLCDRNPIPYEESLNWSLKRFNELKA